MIIDTLSNHPEQLEVVATMIHTEFVQKKNERPAYTPWLASLFVETVYRNQGIAQQLINQLIIYAKSRQIPTIYLKTDNASAYYKKFGWILIETIETTDLPLHIFSYNVQES